jgi:predicted deacylase
MVDRILALSFEMNSTISPQMDPTTKSRPDLSQHLIGTYDLGVPGPIFVFVGGMHGNEPAGVWALQELLLQLEQEQLPLRGRLVCFAGNLEALRLGERYIDRDFNRVWSEEDLAAGPDSGIHEFDLRDRLLPEIEKVIEGATQPVVFLDLHSTSAGGSPFSIIGDTEENRRIAFALPVPVILGLEENVEGALLGYFGERGHIAVGFEGGQHDASHTQGNHLAAAWITLVTGRGLKGPEAQRAKPSFEHLRKAGQGLAGVVEMRYRHQVDVREAFHMVEGFSNFDPIKKGQVLAHEDGKEVLCGEDGLMLLPLYQGQGQDGYFIGREIRRFWLRVSTVLRWLGLGRRAHWLPGIQRVEGHADTLDVNSKIARWWVVEIFHLLGYRRHEPVANCQRFVRRKSWLSK